jgi:hypothetical protein
VKVVVPHHVTVDQAIQIVDRSADNLFEGAAGGSVELLDRKRSWNGPIMDFSLTARLGFISLPISGTAVVDDVNVTIDCELPALVKTFIGEDKVRAGIERKVRGMLAA